MKQDRWHEIEGLLNEAVQLPSPQRAEFLARIGDAGVRAEVISLLAADSDESAPDFGKILLRAAEIVTGEPSPGDRLAHFRIVRKLGRGGMGVVYLAQDLKLRREVALKLLLAGEHLNDDRLRIFEREARAAAALNHANVVTIYEFGEWENRPFIATELVAGETLAQVIGRGPLSQADSARVGAQILAALAAAHEAGIVHRDLKPANVMLRPDGAVKVLDFGLARLMKDVTLSAGIGAMGTPGYAAPEQWGGKPADSRSDIYAFGCVLYEMLSGTRAMPQRPALKSRALEKIVSRCLESDPARRWQSAAGLERELQKVNGPRGWRRRAVVAAAVAVMVLGVAFALRSRTQVKALTDKDVLVLADFTNKTGDPVFDGTLRQALAIQLEQSPFFKTMDDAQIRQDLRLMRRSPDEPVSPALAHDICIRDGAAATVEGSIAGLGKTYAITLQAVLCQNGSTLAREQIQAGDKEHVLQALGKATTDMRARLGESMASIGKLNGPLEQFTTSSLEALQNYTLGFRLVSTGQFFAAIPYLRQAVDLDPNFAWAYHVLSIAYHTAGDLKSTRIYEAKAFALSDKALEFERLNIVARYYWLVTGETDKAVDAYRALTRRYPRDWSIPNEMSVIYLETGEFEKARQESERAIRLGPKMEPGYRNLLRAYAGMDRFDEARKACAAARAQQLDSATLHSRCLELAYIESDRPAEERETRWFAGRPEEYLSLGLHAAGADFSGQRGKAADLYRRAAEAALRRSLPDIAADFDEADARAAALVGNCQIARRLGRPALALAICGESARAAELLSETAKMQPNGTLWNAVEAPAIRAAIELNRNRPASALQLLASAAPYERVFPEVMWLRGEAYLSMGKGSQAANEFQRILDHKGANWGLFFALSPLQLARAWALKGDSLKSTKGYDGFFAAWKNADSGLPLLRRAHEQSRIN